MVLRRYRSFAFFIGIGQSQWRSPRSERHTDLPILCVCFAIGMDNREPSRVCDHRSNDAATTFPDVPHLFGVVICLDAGILVDGCFCLLSSAACHQLAIVYKMQISFTASSCSFLPIFLFGACYSLDTIQTTTSDSECNQLSVSSILSIYHGARSYPCFAFVFAIGMGQS